MTITLLVAKVIFNHKEICQTMYPNHFWNQVLNLSKNKTFNSPLKAKKQNKWSKQKFKIKNNQS